MAVPTGFEDIQFSPGESFAYEIKRNAIMAQDTSYFLRFFDVERIRTAGKLHDLYRRVHFGVGGFDDDPREVHEIPELRNYYRKLVPQWPYFFYADALENGFVSELVKCLVDNISTAYHDEQSRVISKLSPDEMNKVWRQLAEGFRDIAGKDGMLNQQLFNARIEELKAYLKGTFGPSP